ncbi:hypothetical protein CEXT_122991 [Caerostris extrusa]|uniref:Uncharacterized protein n=1 Tax=Caerostris extrusa TaxID=172846 RepID=A0AAV4PTX4_CAEEX|nr:hypothetical protein CEXT_122991 [Caerostris extrusa]
MTLLMKFSRGISEEGGPSLEWKVLSFLEREVRQKGGWKRRKMSSGFYGQSFPWNRLRVGDDGRYREGFINWGSVHPQLMATRNDAVDEIPEGFSIRGSNDENEFRLLYVLIDEQKVFPGID